MNTKPHFDLFSQAQRFGGITHVEEILDHLELTLRPFGLSHFLVTALPMPGRSVDNQVMRKDWPDSAARDGSSVGTIDNEDPIITRTIEARAPFTVTNDDENEHRVRPSGLFLAALGDEPKLNLVSVPIQFLHPFQGAVLLAGPSLNLDRYAMLGLEFFCASAFERLHNVGALLEDRPGSLSVRERRVLDLTAIGKTAGEIAKILMISQRTVHAHLSNASNKLRAKNKTHTVMQAIRYGQIDA